MQLTLDELTLIAKALSNYRSKTFEENAQIRDLVIRIDEYVTGRIRNESWRRAV